MARSKTQKSQWGLPKNVAHPSRDPSRSLRKAIDATNASSMLVFDALDALEAGLIGKRAYQRELERLKPIIERGLASIENAKKKKK